VLAELRVGHGLDHAERGESRSRDEREGAVVAQQGPEHEEHRRCVDAAA
jgi:hypothetical protein